MINITANISKVPYKTTIQAGTNTVFSDEPETEGGQNTGFTPKELLAASLGACTSITLKMYADRKNWNLETVKVDVNLDVNSETGISAFSRQISVTGNLSEEEKARLLHVANACPVHKILSGTIQIETKLL